MKRAISIFMIFILLLSSLALLSSCSNENDKVTVTFNFNYNNSPKDEKVQIDSGSIVEKPKDPERENYIFIGWFTDENNSNPFDFSERVESDLVLFAGWLSDTSEYLDSFIDLVLSGVTIKYASGDCYNSVTEDVVLPKKTNELDIKWYTNNENVVSVEGKVNRPKDTNENIILTAELSIGDYSKQKQFSLTVIREKEYSLEKTVDLSIDELEAMNKGGKYPLDLEYDQSGRVTSILGEFSPIIIESKEDALWSLASVRSLIGISDPVDDLYAYNSIVDEFGSTYTFNQIIDGVQVYGRSVSVATDINGVPVSLNSSVIDEERIDKTIGVTKEDIKNKVNSESENDIEITDIEEAIYSLYEYEKNQL